MDSIQIRLNLSRNGTVEDEAQYDLQPNTIVNIVLKKHQLQSVLAMVQLEKNNIRISEHDYLVSEIGVLSNKVGSGKSLCVLGLIATQPRLDIQDFVTDHFGNSMFVMNDRSYMIIKGGNLIVVPNHLISIWEEYLNMYTTFKHVTIKKQMFPIDWDEISTNDVVLCNTRYYNMFHKTCPWVWSRVIFDEADSISIPACIKPNARFVWFVSSSLNNLLFCNGFYLKCDNNGILTRVVTRGIPRQGYIKSTFKELDDPRATSIIHGIVVKMNDTYIDRHTLLPPVYEHIIRCKDPIYLCVLRDVVSETVISLLQSCDTAGALDHLGCPIDTKENIISYICRSFHVQMRNYERKLDYLNNIESIDSSISNDAVQEKIRKTNDKISEIVTKLNTIHEKIDQLTTFTDRSNVYCPICMEHDVEELCLYMCCLNVFCTKCVNQMITQEKHSETCPLCRGDLKKNDIILRSLHETSKTEVSENKYSKVIELVKDIYTTIDRRVLIFIWHDNTLAHLTHLLGTMHVNQFRSLSGNTNTIRRTIEWFNMGKIRVLLVNASVYGCGLNLIGATDIIFFQKMNNELEKQLTGRAYRIGRTHELHIHRVMHETE